MPEPQPPESGDHPRPTDEARRRCVRGHLIAGHLADVRAWLTPEGHREEQAVCECGWKGVIRTEFEAGNRDADEHLMEMFVIRRPLRSEPGVSSDESAVEPECSFCGLDERFGLLIAGSGAYICLECVEGLRKVVGEIRDEESVE
jgi:ClpX C4-type zinc finger